MVTLRTYTELKNEEPWAHFCPQTKKSTRQNRHLAPKTPTTIEMRHLAVNNKRLSVSTGKPAKKLRTLYKNKLRKQRTRTLSKKVNKDVSGTKTSQSEITTPRAKYIKVPRTQINRINRRINLNHNQSPRHNSVLHQLSQKQVINPYYPVRYSKRKNHNKLPQIGVYGNLQQHHPNKTDHRSKNPKVHIGNEFLSKKGTRLQFLTHPGPTPIEKMNSNFTLRETVEMPAQILESDTEIQEKSEAEISPPVLEPRQALEPTRDPENQERDAPETDTPSGPQQPEEPPKYFSCGQCSQGFHTANEVETHLVKTHGITDFRYRSFTPEGMTPITGPDEPSDSLAEAPDAKEQKPGNEDAQIPTAGLPETQNEDQETTTPEDPPRVATPGLAPEGEAEDMASEFQTVKEDPQIQTAGPSETSETNKETLTPEAPLRVATPVLAPEKEGGDLAPGPQKAANNETMILETSPGVATLGSAPEGEDEDHAFESQNAVTTENDNTEVQEENLTNKIADEWARVEHLDHEINRIKAMTKAANTTQESAKNTDKKDKKDDKQNPQVNNPPTMEATPGSAPGEEALVLTTGKSDREFLTFDESGDVVKGTWNSSPPKSENYRKTQLLLGEVRKDQDQIREKKRAKKTGHKSAQETPIDENSSGKAAQGPATSGEVKSQTKETRNQKAIMNLGELRVDLSDVNLRKDKNPKQTSSKASERKSADKATPTAKPKRDEINTRREPQTRRKTSDAKKAELSKETSQEPPTGKVHRGQRRRRQR